MKIYIRNLFGSLHADGIVVNPFMGDDVILPLMKFVDKSIIVLVKTSNPSGDIVQNVMLKKGIPFWYHILDLVVHHWNLNENMIPVLSSNFTFNVSEIRKIIPDSMPILLAGVGAQGGSYKNLSDLLNSDGVGVFINSSRSILYPEAKLPWRVAIEKAVIRLKKSINKERDIV